MATVALILSVISGLGSLGCLIFVLTKLFPAEGAVKGIFGIICGLYTFIWGWQNRERFGLQQVMMGWTVMVVLGIIANGLARAA